MAVESEEQSPDVVEPTDADAPKIVVPKRRVDPVARALMTTILLVIVLTLVTVLYAQLTNVLGTGAPRTMSEARIISSGAKVEAGSVDPIEWKTYIRALIEDGQYGKAQEWIDSGSATLPDQEIGADMVYMQAELYLAQGELDKVLETADKALETIKKTYEAEKINVEVSGIPSKAVAFGISKNYWELLLLKAEVYEKQGEWELALTVYDEYLDENTTAATVFSQRGKVKEELGDTAGAEKDYRRTLAFIRSDAAALAGLERIGVSE